MESTEYILRSIQQDKLNSLLLSTSDIRTLPISNQTNEEQESDHNDTKIVHEKTEVSAQVRPLISTISIKMQLAKTTLPLVFIGSMVALEDFIKVSNLSKHGIQTTAAASIYNNTFFGLTIMADSGMLSSLTPLMSAEFSKKNYVEVGQYVKQGWLSSSILSMPVITVLLNTKGILTKLGYHPELVEIVVPFSNLMCIVCPALFNIFIDNSFLKVTSRLKKMMLVYTLMTSSGMILATILIPQHGLVGLGYTLICEIWGAWAGLKIHFWFADEFTPYQLFNFRSMERKHFFKILNKGSPLMMLSLTDSLRVFLFGKWLDSLGTVSLAMNEVIGACLQFVTPPTLGVRQATQVLVAHAWGTHDLVHMKRMGNQGILTEILIDLIPTITFVAFPLSIVEYFNLDIDPEEYETNIRLILFSSALSKILESIQGCTTQNLFATLDINFPVLVQILITLFLTLPLSYFLTFEKNLDMLGLNTALCIGSAASIIPLMIRWCNKNNADENIQDNSQSNDDNNEPNEADFSIPLEEPTVPHIQYMPSLEISENQSLVEYEKDLNEPNPNSLKIELQTHQDLGNPSERSMLYSFKNFGKGQDKSANTNPYKRIQTNSNTNSRKDRSFSI